MSLQNWLKRSAWIGAGVAACVGCTQTSQQPRNRPGQLPGENPTAAKSDRSPHVHATTYFAHGHLLERQGNFDRAIEQYRSALELKADFVICRNRLGITLNKIGRHAEATSQFRQALAVSPNLAHLLNNLGFSLYLEGNYDEAEQTLAKAVSLKPDFARGRMNHALTLAKLRRYDDAFQEMLKTGSQADAAYNMGMILTESGLLAEAAQYFEAALAAKPNMEVARVQLAEVARLQAQREELERERLAVLAALPQPATLAPSVDDTTNPVAATAETPQPQEVIVAVPDEPMIAVSSVATDADDQIELAATTPVASAITLESAAATPLIENAAVLTTSIDSRTDPNADPNAPAEMNTPAPLATGAAPLSTLDGEIVRRLIDDWMFAIRRRTDLAAEFWCRLELYMLTGAHNEDDLLD